jgi:hypothetical protein
MFYDLREGPFGWEFSSSWFHDTRMIVCLVYLVKTMADHRDHTSKLSISPIAIFPHRFFVESLTIRIGLVARICRSHSSI